MELKKKKKVKKKLNPTPWPQGGRHGRGGKGGDRAGGVHAVRLLAPDFGVSVRGGCRPTRGDTCRFHKGGATAAVSPQ